MNCKKGNLARVVRSAAGNNGKIVRCLAWEADVLFVFGSVSLFRSGAWLIDPPLPALDGSFAIYCVDEKLRPIRDPGEDATDEMVLRVGKPVANPEGVPA